MTQDKRGFTLIELLVVVAIIGILAAVGVVAYNGYTSSAKVNTMKYNHQVVVKTMKTFLFSCATQGYVTLKTGPDGSTSNFQCSSGADNLRVQFSAHFYWAGFRNVWRPTNCCAVAGDTRMAGYMVGYSCSNSGAMGGTLICNEGNNKMWIETNYGPTNGCSGCATTSPREYIEIPES
jgi:type IV pilus assembly protein PilA